MTVLILGASSLFRENPVHTCLLWKSCFVGLQAKPAFSGMLLVDPVPCFGRFSVNNDQVDRNGHDLGLGCVLGDPLLKVVPPPRG